MHIKLTLQNLTFRMSTANLLSYSTVEYHCFVDQVWCRCEEVTIEPAWHTVKFLISTPHRWFTGLLLLFHPDSILGDPGTISWGGKKSKRTRKKFGRKKVKNAKFLTFLRPNFFLVRLDFSPAPLTAPGSPRMSWQTTDTVLPFPADHDTHEFFCRPQSNVFDAASFLQTNLHGTLKCTTLGRLFCVASWLFRVRIITPIVLSSKGKLTGRFVCHRAVSMATVYQLTIKFDQDKFKFLDTKARQAFLMNTRCE